MPEYSYRGYTIRQEIRPTLTDNNATAWDVIGNGDIIKRNFLTLDVAKHYIDVCIKPTVNQYEQIDLFSGGVINAEG